MAQLTVDIGGRPGIDCRGFCEYCYFKRVKDVPPLGCRYCLPFKKGCDYCSRSVQEQYSGFRSFRDIADDTLARLNVLNEDISRVTISGGGDPSCYPRFRELIELLSSMEAPLHIGYTSGKGFDSPDIAKFLVDNGMSELSFTVFSVNAGWRPQKGTLLSLGVDNLFDKTYAEHISRRGSAVTGFTTTTRINEVGRNLWVKANAGF
jgi:NifB/MoaA-like Fe-S oxidoreductase